MRSRSARLAGRLAPRVPLFALDLGFGSAMAAALWLGLSRPALAYVDPSVMTYTIQALAGVAVALSAVLGVVWRRARRWLLRALRIDENAGKVVEPPVRELSASDAPAREAALAEAGREAADERARQGRRPYSPLAWGPRLALALLSCASLAFTVLVASPLEMVVTGSGSLSFSVLDVWGPLAAAAVVVAAVVALALSAARGRAFDVVLAVVAALGAAAVIQRLALNTGLPLADGAGVEWGSYSELMAGTAVAWLAIVGGAYALAWRRPLALRLGSAFVAVLLVLAQGVNLGVLVAGNAEDLSRPIVTQEGLYEVSPKGNVVLFVLDTLDTTYTDEVFAKYPEKADELGGFTYFRNSSGSMIPTRYGVPYLVTGHMLDPDQAVFDTDEVKGWFSEDNLLDTVAAQGYSVGVYSDSLNEGLDALGRQTMNVHAASSRTVDFLSCVRALGGCGLYRSLPWALKPSFWFTTDQLNAATAPADDSGDGSTPYRMDDLGYADTLRSRGLSATDDAENGAYRVIHLQGSHLPITMDENANPTSSPETHEALIRQSAGALEIVNEYCEQLDELGLLDKTTVIITADHGRWPFTDAGDRDWNGEHLDRTTTPALLVKPAGADRSVPMQLSEAPTGHLDIPATVEWACGAQTQGPTVFQVPDGEQRERTFYWVYHDGKVDHELYEYAIGTDALDFDDWHETGRTWPVDMEGYR